MTNDRDVPPTTHPPQESRFTHGIHHSSPNPHRKGKKTNDHGPLVSRLVFSLSPRCAPPILQQTSAVRALATPSAAGRCDWVSREHTKINIRSDYYQSLLLSALHIVRMTRVCLFSPCCVLSVPRAHGRHGPRGVVHTLLPIHCLVARLHNHGKYCNHRGKYNHTPR